MSPDVALLMETWDVVRPNVNKNARLETAEALVRVFSEFTDLSEIEVDINEFDKVMKTAIIAEVGIEEDDDDYDEWE